MASGRPGRILRCLALLAACLAAAAGALAQSATQAVLLYDGSLPPHAALEVAARKALAPSRSKVVLRTMSAGRAETATFLRRHGLSRKDAPVLLVMSGPQAESRILRRTPLPAADPAAAVRKLFAALQLPVEQAAPGPPKPGTVLTLQADGGAEEKKMLVSLAGRQRLEGGVRILDPAGAAIYRLRLPPGLRLADLRGELGGDYVVEWGFDRSGPWTPLMDSEAYFGAAADLIRERTHPVARLDPVLGQVKGNLFLRVRSSGSGRNRAELAKLEVVALAKNQTSGQEDWEIEAGQLKLEALASLLPDGKKGTPLAGVLKTDTTLEVARSPYLLMGDVMVGPSATLRIEPGVTVRVLGTFALRVQGALTAKGTAQAPILFTPAAPSQADDWKGIQFVPLPNRPAAKSVLEYCRIARAAVGLDLNRFPGEVSYCILEDGHTGVTLKGEGEGRVHHNRFLRCVRGLLVERGAGTVTENEWEDCQVALEVTATPDKGTLRFESNSVRGSRIAAVTYLKRPGRQMPPLLLPNNHWSGTPAERMVDGGPNAAEVRFEPLLEAPPAGVGPGW